MEREDLGAGAGSALAQFFDEAIVEPMSAWAESEAEALSARGRRRDAGRGRADARPRVRRPAPSSTSGCSATHPDGAAVLPHLRHGHPGAPPDRRGGLPRPRRHASPRRCARSCAISRACTSTTASRPRPTRVLAGPLMATIERFGGAAQPGGPARLGDPVRPGHADRLRADARPGAAGRRRPGVLRPDRRGAALAEAQAATSAGPRWSRRSAPPAPTPRPSRRSSTAPASPGATRRSASAASPGATSSCATSAHITEPQAIFDECVQHLRAASNGGNIEIVLTAFAPTRPGERWGPRIWNSQLVRFAGYPQPDGSVIGDRANLALTEAIERLRLDAAGGAVGLRRAAAGRRRAGPRAAALRVRGRGRPAGCRSPTRTRPAFDALGLQWCAVPAIANFRLEIGGIDYGCVPFNGWFMGTEIARNLFEEKRYDRAEAIAAALRPRHLDRADALARPGLPGAQRRGDLELPEGAGDAGRPPDRLAAVHDPRDAREARRPRVPGAVVLDRAARSAARPRRSGTTTCATSS